MQAIGFAFGNRTAGILASQTWFGCLKEKFLLPHIIPVSIVSQMKQKEHLFGKAVLGVAFSAALLPHGGEGSCDGRQLLLRDLGLVFDEVDEHSARKAEQSRGSTWLMVHFSNPSPAKSLCCCPLPFYSLFIFIPHPDRYLQ